MVHLFSGGSQASRSTATIVRRKLQEYGFIVPLGQALEPDSFGGVNSALPRPMLRERVRDGEDGLLIATERTVRQKLAWWGISVPDLLPPGSLWAVNFEAQGLVHLNEVEDDA